MAEKPRKLRVGVVFGGRSGEHEVSLAGAASVMSAIDRGRFEVLPIGIAKDGRWLMGGDPLRALAQEAERLALTSGSSDAHTKHELLERATAQDTGTSLMRMETSESLPPGLRDRLDVVLVLLHGPQGEDGTIQGLLQLAGVPYTGAGVLASAVGMDKVAMKDIFRAHALPIVEYAVVRRHDWEREARRIAEGIATEIGFPCFVKPANLGSSVGISKAKAAEDLPAAIDLAARYDRRILVERAVQGREVEVAVLGNDEPRVSVPGEVCYPGEWYDYDTKYGAGQTTLKIPAPLPSDVAEEVRTLALRAFRATDCAGMARVDFFIEGERRVLVNEINTIPGFTSTSAYPRLWEASGISYPELISRLIELALERR
ncbi:MAG TPA: D-alanine--D-alanine ligase family protein [Methylomirabilota bacterium]|nr:D-alanine--D-alanine ligase family protein [Methylomirabilota bacterium]